MHLGRESQARITLSIHCEEKFEGHGPGGLAIVWAELNEREKEYEEFSAPSQKVDCFISEADEAIG